MAKKRDKIDWPEGERRYADAVLIRLCCSINSIQQLFCRS
jgi:hypothetical protein